MDRSGVLNDAISQAILGIALLDDRCLKLLECLLREHAAVEMFGIGVKRFGYRDHRCRDTSPIKGRSTGNNAIEVLWITLRLHHRLASPSGAADEITMGRIASIIAANQSFGHLRCPMHGQVAEVYLRFEVVQRPFGNVPWFRLMAGIRAHRRLTTIH